MKTILLSIALLAISLGTNAQQKAEVVINADLGKEVISKHIYGHFAEHLGHCIYDGLWVGENSPIPNVGGVRKDIIDALKHIKIPNLRWPGGCFADEYHWMDGIGERSKRPKMVNTHWGGVIEDNSFGTHEFMNLCEALQTEPYICGNVGSGSVEEMSKWVEYMTMDGESPMANLRKQNGREKPWKLTYFGVGNENWGCGGNMTAQFYTDQYRRFQTYVRNYGDNRILKIGGGPNVDDYNWMDTFMKGTSNGMRWGVSLHHYSFPNGWGDKGPATGFSEWDYFQTIDRGWFMDELITKHTAIMDRYDPQKRTALVVDEWGSWFTVEKGTNPGFLFQQNTIRDAILAGVTLNVFHKHADRVKMANIAQLVNVLQALFLTQGEKMILTPTYHLFDMYKVHQEATMLPTDVKCGKYTYQQRSLDQVSVSSSKDSNGVIHMSFVNVDLKQDADITCSLRGVNPAKIVSAKIIHDQDVSAHNTFDQPNNVTLKEFSGATLKNGTVLFKLPAKSIVTIAVK